MTTTRRQIEIRVLDVHGRVLEFVEVTATPLSGGSVVRLHYDRRVNAHVVAEFAPGRYSIKAETAGLEMQQRSVSVPESGLRDTFVLGRTGLPFYYRGRVRVPFDVPDRVGVLLKYGMHDRTTDLNGMAIRFGLEPMSVGENVNREGVRIFGVPADRAADGVLFEGSALAEPYVRYAGKVVRLDTDSVSVLTNECVVKFEPGVDGQAAALARELEVVRPLPYITNGLLLRARANTSSRQLLDISNSFAEDPAVIWAEPNLVSTAVLHAMAPFPNDQRLAAQLHHPIVGSVGAWNVMRTQPALGNIVVAVVDVGCDIKHPDLVGNLTGRYNFAAYSNALLEHPHGTKASGIVAAVIDNGIGVAGGAGFCKFIAVEKPIGTDEEYAAMFRWCAGLDPGQPLAPRFPGPLAQGVDVISNSWGIQGRALSGTIAGAFDTLAADGRGGRGCVILFSTGNENTDFTNLEIWAAHRAVISVGASTVSPPDPAEVRVSDSNYGASIDVCAPGGDASAGGALTLSTTAAFDYVNDGYDTFGQTSCACAQAAGVAAVILEINPSLQAEDLRGILHDTAVKIDGQNVDPIGHYDADGHSNWYGFGRIDAHAAAVAARRSLGASAVSTEVEPEMVPVGEPETVPSDHS